MPHQHPQDVLSECVVKLVFLADTLSLYSFHKEVNFSPQGLAGLCQIVNDISNDIDIVAPNLVYQPQGMKL